MEVWQPRPPAPWQSQRGAIWQGPSAIPHRTCRTGNPVCWHCVGGTQTSSSHLQCVEQVLPRRHKQKKTSPKFNQSCTNIARMRNEFVKIHNFGNLCRRQSKWTTEGLLFAWHHAARACLLDRISAQPAFKKHEPSWHHCKINPLSNANQLDSLKRTSFRP